MGNGNSLDLFVMQCDATQAVDRMQDRPADVETDRIGVARSKCGTMVYEPVHEEVWFNANGSDGGWAQTVRHAACDMVTGASGRQERE